MEQCQWNRVDMTLFGMEVVDSFKIIQYALSSKHKMSSWDLDRFVNELAFDLMHNKRDSAGGINQSSTQELSEEVESVPGVVSISENNPHSESCISELNFYLWRKV